MPESNSPGPPYPSSPKAYENLDFINSPTARAIRIQCELAEPGQRFRRQGVRNTIVFFGSARTLSRADAEANLAKVRAETAGLDPIPRLKRLAEAEAKVAGSVYYEAARRLAYELTKWSMETIACAEFGFSICSGGGPGIMEAANRGAHEAGGRSIGLGISLPMEQHANPWVTPELNFEFHYFFIRKYWFLYPAKTLVVFPGGFGTMDELFEMLTLIQTSKTQKYIPVILFGSEFWNRVLNFEAFLQYGLISEHDLSLFKIIDTVEEARDHIIAELLEHYVRDPEAPCPILPQRMHE